MALKLRFGWRKSVRVKGKDKSVKKKSVSEKRVAKVDRK